MKRILYVEDDAACALVMHNRLRDAGYEVTGAENGAKGLLLARESRFDLFLLSAALASGVPAIEVCRRLKQMTSAYSVPTILFARSALPRDEVHQTYAAGADAFVPKSELANLEDVLHAQLRNRAQRDELADQNRGLADQLRRLQESQAHAGDEEGQNGNRPDSSQLMRELGANRPDGLMLVDAEGVVHLTDRNARDLLGNQLKGVNLGRLAPASGLEAFVRDARTEAREGFRFDLPARGGQGSRALQATVVPLLTQPGESDPGMRVVLLLDSSRRRVTSELLRMQEYAIPRREVGVLVDAARRVFGPASLIGVSEPMESVRRQVARAAGLRDTVLVRGEPGTGKQHVARAIHFGGNLGGHFIPVSCRSQTEEHLDSEIFGHVKGAHADALSDQPGALQQGEHGTVYLEGIDALPLALQQKLVAAIEQGQTLRAGAQRPEKIEVRVIASTSENLEEAVAAGRFDAKLVERLATHDIRIAPLRERPQDIPTLVEHFAQRVGLRPGEWQVDDEVVQILQGYAWEQNVRDLKICVEQACARSLDGRLCKESLSGDVRESGDELPPHDLQPMPQRAKPPVVGPLSGSSTAASPTPNGPYSDFWIGPDDAISFDVYERKVILRALHETNGNKMDAAELLKVGKSTLYRKLKRYGIA